MHPDIRKALSVIDKQIADLAKAKESLIAIFGSMGNSTLQEIESDKPLSRAAEVIQRVEAAKGESRKESIIKLLDKEGPLTRTEMAQKSGIPLGTLSFVLRDKNVFHNQEGKWSLIVNDNVTTEQEEVKP